MKIERDIAMSYNGINQMIIELQYIRDNYPHLFEELRQVELINLMNARAILENWLEEGPDRDWAIKKTKQIIRQVEILLGTLETGSAPSSSQGLCFDGYIYTLIAKTINSTFYDLDSGCFNPTFKQVGCVIDVKPLCNILRALIANLQINRPLDYVALEKQVSSCISSILGLIKHQLVA